MQKQCGKERYIDTTINMRDKQEKRYKNKANIGLNIRDSESHSCY